ncbi:MAG: HAMP domain-containing sensor histidine kinase [Lachnospiraceae bacterium]|nr:HAMP domain-containing sensor histidine kinase [Lachnospiraceae bacterium]
MKILTNKKIKVLFIWIVSCVALFSGLMIAVALWQPQYIIHSILVCCLSMCAVIVAILYWYFREQNMIMESAIEQISEYISGDHDARLECNEEGELYRLFHQVNTLVSILNAHAEKEGQAKKFLKDTISDISHQLKTPLAALNIYNGIMQEEAKDNSTLGEFTQLSEQELDRIETLVQNLLKITKLDAGTLVMELSLENISDMMDVIKKQFSFRAEQEEKEFSVHGEENITFLCDRTWILEAVSNIVKNAFDHTEKGNSISVEWVQFASVVQIVIRDNGTGIHPEDLYHIFKRFYRSRFSKDTQGVGLGLPLAKMIVEAHNGTIEVSSEYGLGSTFTLDFLIPTKL